MRAIEKILVAQRQAVDNGLVGLLECFTWTDAGARSGSEVPCRSTIKVTTQESVGTSRVPFDADELLESDKGESLDETLDILRRLLDRKLYFGPAGRLHYAWISNVSEKTDIGGRFSATVRWHGVASWRVQ